MSTMSSGEDTAIASLLAFWFAPDADLKKWFLPSASFDQQCKDNFLPLVTKARAHQLNTWGATADGILTLMLLMDQLPRNIFRGLAQGFSSDKKGQEIAIEAIARGFDRKVALERQMFFYLPFMHGEDMISQVASLGLFQGLAARTPEGTELREGMTLSVEFSQKHMDVLRRFGRFLSRNEALGRLTTREEREFLQQKPGGI